jgi:hypothetical protein
LICVKPARHPSRRPARDPPGSFDHDDEDALTLTRAAEDIAPGFFLAEILRGEPRRGEGQRPFPEKERPGALGTPGRIVRQALGAYSPPPRECT